MPPPIPGSARKFVAEYLKRVLPAVGESGLQWAHRASLLPAMSYTPARVEVSGALLRGGVSVGKLRRTFTIGKGGRIATANLSIVETGGGTGLISRLYRSEADMFRGRGVAVNADFAHGATLRKFSDIYGSDRGRPGSLSITRGSDIPSGSWYPAPVSRESFIRHGLPSQSGRLGAPPVRSNPGPILSRRLRTPRVGG